MREESFPRAIQTVDQEGGLAVYGVASPKSPLDSTRFSSGRKMVVRGEDEDHHPMGLLFGERVDVGSPSPRKSPQARGKGEYTSEGEDEQQYMGSRRKPGRSSYQYSVRESLLAEAWERRRDHQMQLYEELRRKKREEDEEDDGESEGLRVDDDGVVEGQLVEDEREKAGAGGPDDDPFRLDRAARRKSSPQSQNAAHNSSNTDAGDNSTVRRRGRSCGRGDGAGERRRAAAAAAGGGGRRSRFEKGSAVSLTDDDFEELKGCMDLGFAFDERSSDDGLCKTLPALHVYCAVTQSLHSSPIRSAALSLSASASSSPTSTRRSRAASTSPPSWRVATPGDDPEDIKEKLKLWAQAVACNMRVL